MTPEPDPTRINEPSPGLPEIPGAPALEVPELSYLDRRGISLIAFAIVSLFVIGVLYQGIGFAVTEILIGDMPTADSMGLFRVINGVGEIVLLLLPALVVTRLAAARPREFLRIRKVNLASLLVPLISIFSLEQMLQIYGIFQDRMQNALPEPLRSQINQVHDLIDNLTKMLVTPGSTGEFIVILLIVALIPALSEELLFRGFFQRSLERGMTPLRSAVVTGIIFAGFHLNPFSFVPLAALGIFLGYIAMRSGSILTSMAAHFFNNLIACVSVFFGFRDDFVVAGNATEMSVGGLLLTFWFFGVIFLVSMFYFHRITRPDAGTGVPGRPGAGM